MATRAGQEPRSGSVPSRRSRAAKETPQAGQADPLVALGLARPASSRPARSSRFSAPSGSRAATALLGGGDRSRCSDGNWLSDATGSWPPPVRDDDAEHSELAVLPAGQRSGGAEQRAPGRRCSRPAGSRTSTLGQKRAACSPDGSRTASSSPSRSPIGWTPGSLAARHLRCSNFGPRRSRRPRRAQAGS